MKKTGVVASLVLAVSLMTAGCGYALAGRGNALPATIRIIGIPDFQNKSTVPEFDRSLTEAVREEFQGKGRYTISSQAEGVDGLLIGTITSITFPPTAFTADNQVSRSLVIVRASIEFREVATNKVIWANPSYEVRDEYQLSTSNTADPTAMLTQDVNARQRLARAFARSVVTAILETF